jgi:hypothetical protein
MIEITHTKTPKTETVTVTYQGQEIFEGSTITPKDLWNILEKANVPMKLVEVQEFDNE